MAFRDSKEISSETLQVMSQAYDAVHAKLGITSPGPRSAEIAAKIVTLMYDGELDAIALCAKVCAELI